MDRRLLIFLILSALCWGVVIYGVVLKNGDAIEAVDDEVWACTASNNADLLGFNDEVIAKITLGDTLHLLASNEDHPNRVMVQTSNGTRGWVENEILPNYYKIRSIDISEPAHFNVKTFKKKIIGQEFGYLEEKYAVALQIVSKKNDSYPDKNFSAVFPMKVHTKGSAHTTKYATVEFEDGKAIAVETDSIYSKKEARSKLDPLIFTFLDHGICVKAAQKAKPTYTSKLPEGAEKRKSGDTWIDNIGNLLLALVALVFLAAFPVLLVGPLLALVFLYVYDDFYRWLLAILIVVLAIIIFNTIYAIGQNVSYLLFVSNVVSAVAILFFCDEVIY